MYYISAKKPHGSATEPCINIRKETIKETIFCKWDLYFEGAYESFPPQKSCNVAGALIWQFPPKIPHLRNLWQIPQKNAPSMTDSTENAPDIHQIVKLQTSISWYTFKLNQFLVQFKIVPRDSRHWGTWLSRICGIRGCSVVSGNCHTESKYSDSSATEPFINVREKSWGFAMQHARWYHSFHCMFSKSTESTRWGFSVQGGEDS